MNIEPNTLAKDFSSKSGGKNVHERTPLVVSFPSKNSNVSSSIESNKNNDDLHRGAYEDVTPTWKEMTGIVMPYIRPLDFNHTVYAILALLSVMTGKLIDILPPLAIKHAVDLISERTSDYHSILYSILFFFGLKLVSLMNESAQDLAKRTVSFDAERRFGITTFAHLHHLSLSYHLEKHIGEITRVMNRGVESVSTLISSYLFYVVPILFETAVVSAMFFHLGTPWITFSTLVSVIVYLLFTITVTSTRIKYRRALVQANDAVSTKETETLVNYETVAMFGRTQYEIDQYADLRRKYKDRRVEFFVMFTLLETGQKFIRLAGISAGLIIAGYAAVSSHDPTNNNNNNNKITAGSFVVIQMYINQLFEPLRVLGFQYRMLVQAYTDLEKAITMLLRKSEVEDSPNAIVWNPLPTTNNDDSMNNNYNNNSHHASGEVIFRNVSFHYKMETKHRALGTSLNVPFQSGRGRGRFHGMAMMDMDDKHKKKPEGNNNSTRKWWQLWAKVTLNENKTTNNDNVDPRISKELSSMENQEDSTTKKKDSNHQKAKLGGVDKIDFTISAGKKVALVGASGSGKTTLIRLILRLYDTDDGSIYIDGNDVRDVTQQSLRENIGVVAQDTILFNASLRENIIYGKPDATEEQIWSAVRTAALEDFVQGLPNQLDTMVGERGMKLSGGERQRVGMARCVIKNPQLILLDEATSALDSTTEKEIQKNMSKICEGRTTLMIAHRLSTARNCDQIIVLDKGKIVERGTHDELLEQNGKYAHMWKIQTDPVDD